MTCFHGLSRLLHTTLTSMLSALWLTLSLVFPYSFWDQFWFFVCLFVFSVIWSFSLQFLFLCYLYFLNGYKVADSHTFIILSSFSLTSLMSLTSPTASFPFLLKPFNFHCSQRSIFRYPPLLLFSLEIFLKYMIFLKIN